MTTKLVVLAVICVGLFAFDRPRLKKAGRRERIVYGALVLCTAYLSLLFAGGLDWPNFDDLIGLLFGAAANAIFEGLEGP